MATEPYSPRGRETGTRQSLGSPGAGPGTAAAEPGGWALPDLHPRGVGEILDLSLEVFAARFVSCVGFATLLWVPYHVLERVTQHMGEMARLLQSMGGTLVSAWLLQSLTLAVVTTIVYDHLQGRRSGALDALRPVIARLLPLLAAVGLTTLLVMLGTCCFIVPGILANWIFAVVTAALVLERLGPVQAVRRSAQLMTNDSAHTFLRWLGVAVVQFAIFLPMSSVAGGLDFPDVRLRIQEVLHVSGVAFDALDIVVSSLFMGIATAFAGIWATILYVDARIRLEGFDLQMRLERLGGRVPPESDGA